MLTEDIYRIAYRRFREKLRQARLEAELTQRQVARLLGKPQSFMSKVESGERRLDFVESQALARIYGKTFEYFQDAGGGADP